MPEGTGDLTGAFEEAEAALETLQAEIESCHQAIIGSRVAIGLGLATLAAVSTILPAYATATVVFAAITAALGGTVWLGATRSTREELYGKREALEARQLALFDLVAQQNGWSGEPGGPAPGAAKQ